MKNWRDEISLRWTLRDVEAHRLKTLPITEAQLQELLGLGLVEVQDERVKLTSAGVQKLG
jgi:hypothetical protein